MPNNCKYYKKMRRKDYNRCIRDNSIRRKVCRCPYYKQSLRSKVKGWFEDRIYEFTYWLEGVISGRSKNDR